MNLNDKFVCVSWGRPGMSKGFEYLLSAMIIISKRIPNVILLLILGSIETHKSRYQNFCRFIEKNNLQKNIKILSSVSYQKLGDYIAAADCAVIPSTSEGFGYSAVEACTMGIPVVATNVGSLPEVVSGKFIFVKSKDPDSIAKGIMDVKEKKYISNEIKIFTWEKAITNYLNIYQEILGQKK